MFWSRILLIATLAFDFVSSEIIDRTAGVPIALYNLVNSFVGFCWIAANETKASTV
jgi:hypothetical protein